MNRLFAFIVFFFAATNIMAQPIASFDSMQRNMGSIMWNRAHNATFVVTNTGKEPLVIKNVETSCGCTEATWTKEPIAVGKTGTVSAVYNAEMLGHFNKQLAVYTNTDTKPIYLALTGVVVSDAPEYDGEYLYQMGTIRVNVNEMVFDDVNLGDMPQQTIEVYNAGTEEYTPMLMHLPKYITAQAVPEKLRPGQGGKIIVTLDSRKLLGMGLTQTSVYLSRYSGDKVGKENEMEISAVLLPSFEQMNEAQLSFAPVTELSAEEIVIENPGTKKKAKGNITIANKGKSSLNIRSLQVFNTAMNVDVKRKIEPGTSTRLNVAIIMRYLKRSKSPLRILMITNDPKRPKIDIDVKILK